MKRAKCRCGNDDQAKLADRCHYGNYHIKCLKCGEIGPWARTL